MGITIPNYPKIELKNYLLELVDEKEGKENSIYLNDISGIIKQIWNDIVKNNWKEVNVREFIPKNLGIIYSGIYAYKNGRKAISIQMLYKLLILWGKYCNKTKKDVESKWNEIFNSNFSLSTHNKCQKVVLPKFISPKLSYLMGWLCGDGHFSDSGNHYIVKISEKSTKQLWFVLKPLIKELFNLDAPIFKRYMNGYAVQFGSKPILRFLKNVLKISVGKIPSIIKNMDGVNKRYFLMGIFDSEGSINEDYMNSAIVITQAKKEFLIEVSEISKEIGVNFNKICFNKNLLGEWYTLRIRKKSEILKFSKLINSCHIDKSRKIQNLVRKIEKNGYCRTTIALRTCPILVTQ